MRYATLMCLVMAGCVDGQVGGDDLAVVGGGDGSIEGDGQVDGSVDLAPPPTPFVYVSGSSPQITRFVFDEQGRLTQPVVTQVTGSPSFLAVDPARRHLYAVDERTPGGVQAYGIDPTNGALTHIGTDQSSAGNGPAHLSVDASGHWVLVANYGNGIVAVLPIDAMGRLGAAVSNPLAGTNAHQILSRDGFAFVPCKGADYVAQYTFDAATGALAANAVAKVPTATGAGPRHLAFHPDGQHAYVINENDSTMIAFDYDAGAGRLSATQTLSTVPPGFSGSNTGAEVVVHPSGRFLYGSNRGDDSIVVYTLDAAGHMTVAGFQKTGGQTPRSFTIDPSGRWLIVANQGSNDVHVFAIDAQSGLLTASGTPVTVTAPSFVGVVPLP